MALTGDTAKALHAIAERTMLMNAVNRAGPKKVELPASELAFIIAANRIRDPRLKRTAAERYKRTYMPELLGAIFRRTVPTKQ